MPSTLALIRRAIWVQLPSWPIGFAIIGFTAPEQFTTFALLALGFNFPINLGLYLASRNKRYRGLVPFYTWLPNVSANATITFIALHQMHAWMFALGANIVILLYGLLALPLLLCQSTTVVAANSVAIFGALALEYATGAMPAALFYTYGALILATIQIGYQIARGRNRQDRSAFLQELKLSEQKELLAQEKSRSEKLLHAILPRSIADRLKSTPKTIAERYDSVSILFADLSGFTVWSSGRDPKAVVEFLDEIFTRFDTLAAALGLERIKTIGDAYMIASGLPDPRPDHARALVELALQMQEAIAEIRHRSGVPLNLRIGIHSGPVVAGVIGATKFSYDLWGDAVNIASRMESHGKPNEVHISEDTYRLILGEFETSPTQTTEIKGKGPMKTCFVLGRLQSRRRGSAAA